MNGGIQLPGCGRGLGCGGQKIRGYQVRVYPVWEYITTWLYCTSKQHPWLYLKYLVLFSVWILRISRLSASKIKTLIINRAYFVQFQIKYIWILDATMRFKDSGKESCNQASPNITQNPVRTSIWNNVGVISVIRICYKCNIWLPSIVIINFQWWYNDNPTLLAIT